MMEGVTTILFDMDGTLYQDFDFHRPYLRYILEDSGMEGAADQAAELADRILDGRSVPMNRFYRVVRKGGIIPSDVAELEQCMAAGLVEELLFDSCYQNGLGGMHFLGDAWEVVTYMADILGVLEEKGEYAFCRVREEMHAKSIQRNEPLLEVLSSLKGRYETILLSNSPQKSASDFIDKLGFGDAFSCKIYDAAKPYGLLRRLWEERPGLRCHMNQVVSIGDHAFNEIVNIGMAGGRTIWMNPYADAPWIPCTLQIKNLDELMHVLKTEF